MFGWCDIGWSGLRIQGEDIKSRLLRTLGDEDTRKILVLTMRQAKSASDLSYETRIPLSSVYRHVHELNEAGLLAVERVVITEQGKRQEMFRSVVKSIHLYLEPTSTELDVQPNEDVESRFYRLWSSMKELK